MDDRAVGAETDEPAPEPPAEIDESLEARRLSRWLKAMFGGGAERPEPDERPDPRSR